MCWSRIPAYARALTLRPHRRRDFSFSARSLPGSQQLPHVSHPQVTPDPRIAKAGLLPGRRAPERALGLARRVVRVRRARSHGHDDRSAESPQYRRLRAGGQRPLGLGPPSGMGVDPHAPPAPSARWGVLFSLGPPTAGGAWCSGARTRLPVPLHPPLSPAGGDGSTARMGIGRAPPDDVAQESRARRSPRGPHGPTRPGPPRVRRRGAGIDPRHAGSCCRPPGLQYLKSDI